MIARFPIICLMLICIAYSPSSMAAGIKWAGCGITKKAFMQELANAYQAKTGNQVIIQGGGATLGIRGVARGKFDIGGSCRYTLRSNKLERRVLLKPIAWDALVVITNKNNPVKNIHIEQIRGIYMGRISNWKELGGRNAPIRLYIRNGKISGVGHALRSIIFDDPDMEFLTAAKSFRSSAPLEKAVEVDPNAIAITGISSARKRDLRVLTLEGKSASFANIKSGTYLLYRPLYLALSVDETRPEILSFIRFTQSPQGREILRKNGTVPYLDALHLVIKQVDQHKLARDWTN